MDTRKLQTKIWTDSWFMDLSRAGKVLFLYTLTNKNVNLTGIYECNDRVISFETGLAAGELEAAKEELAGKVDFHKDWVRVRNQLRYDPIKGDKNNLWIAYEKQLEAIPDHIKDYFYNLDRGIEAPLEGVESPLEGTKGIGIGKGKGKGIGNKGGVGGSNDIGTLSDIDFIEIAEKYQVPKAFVLSKYDDMVNWHEENPRKNNKANWKATLRNWVKRDAIKLVQEGGKRDKYAAIDATNI